MKKMRSAIGLLLVHSSLLLSVPLATTTIGSYPKPSYIHVPDWFRDMAGSQPSKAYDQYLSHADTAEMLDRATREVIEKQVSLGIDIPTDGEVRRENYIFYYCRNLKSIDFSTLTLKQARNGAWTAYVPTIIDRITPCQESVLVRDYQVAQAATDKPIKVTIPGPMTITDSFADAHYFNDEQLGADLAHAINKEIHALVAAGCRHIQIDEPLFARYPEKALAYGIKNLERCFKDLPSEVMKVVHICCGYPLHLDQENYEKANPLSYAMLAQALDKSTVDAVSIEDAHRRNDLSLLAQFKRKTVILGVVDVSKSNIESVEEIEQHIREALTVIDADRLMIAPDCGLGFLSSDMIHKKLCNMITARSRILAL